MKRVTIEDVAAAAGVSRQTVSRAMNDKGEISPATKERVLQAIQELGYQPNRLAQGMVTQRTKTVGLVMPDITNLFFPEVARGVQDAGRQHDYNVLLCNTDDKQEEELKVLHSLAAQRVDGIFMIGSVADDPELARFADTYSPIILLNRFFEHPNVNSIIVDNERGAFLAVEHLVAQGHRTIGMLSAASSSGSQIRRVRGYEEALKHYGIAVEERLIIGRTPTLEGGYDALTELVTTCPDVTAVFAYNDLLGLGAMRAAHDLGKKVPQDIAVIGFDNIGLTSMVTPSLSSIHVDKYAIGQQAMKRILDILDNSDKAYANIEVGVELIQRESTG